MNTIYRKKLFSKSIIHLSRCKSQSSYEYCLDSVKNSDYENFVCTLLLKNTARSNALAIRSFNVEVARIAEQVSQENIGLMRLKFWEDTLEKCYSNNIKEVPKHPVAMELFKALNRTKLTKRYFNTLLSSRKLHFNLTAFKTLEDMEQYSEQSVSNVYYLVLEGCGIRNVHADHAASHLGKAQGIVQHLRSIQHSRRLNFIPVPQNILIKNNVSDEDIIRQKSSQKLNDCSFEIASRAHQHLQKARSLLDSVPKEGRSALLPSVFIHDYLLKLQSCDYNVFHPSLQVRSWKLLPQLWLMNFRCKY